MSSAILVALQTFYKNGKKIMITNEIFYKCVAKFFWISFKKIVFHFMNEVPSRYIVVKWNIFLFSVDIFIS